MKKYLLLMFVFSLLLTSCSSDSEDNDSIVIENKSLSVRAGETVKINATSKSDIQYVSESEFYATVDNSGLVNAERVGSCSIFLNNEMKTDKVEILITAKYLTYPDPFLGFGATKEDVIKHFGNPDEVTEDGNFVYKNYSDKTSLAMCSFENGKYTAFGIAVKTAYASEFGSYMRERFNQYKIDGYNIYFIDALSYDKAKTIVLAEIANLSHIYTIYVPIGNETKAPGVSLNTSEYLLDCIKSKTE